MVLIFKKERHTHRGEKKDKDKKWPQKGGIINTKRAVKTMEGIRSQ